MDNRQYSPFFMLQQVQFKRIENLFSDTSIFKILVLILLHWLDVCSGMLSAKLSSCHSLCFIGIRCSCALFERGMCGVLKINYVFFFNFV